MSGRQYLKNQLPVLLINLFGMLGLALFLMACGNSIQSILLILWVWLLVFILYKGTVYFKRKKHLNRLLSMAEGLKERYLLPEIMEEPERAEEQVYYQLLKMAEKSMLEKTDGIEREKKEYQEYIEQWLHEIKTPITAMKLLCENNRCELTRDMLAELENISRFTWQALYYARSGQTEKDYFIREIRLEEIVHGAIADNKYLLRRNQVAVTVEGTKESVYTDEKWVRFILNQIIGNAVKYRSGQPALRFFAARKDNRVLLSVKDNGMGISQSDLPRIFDKGFTGQNGRAVSNSTGIGLYLCRRLCDRLGIGLWAGSEGEGTGMELMLSFPVNDFVTGVQG